MSLIEKLTPEQEALIPVYREKWRKIALSTERIDRDKAVEVLKATYTAIGKQHGFILTIMPAMLPFLPITGKTSVTVEFQMLAQIIIQL